MPWENRGLLRNENFYKQPVMKNGFLMPVWAVFLIFFNYGSHKGYGILLIIEGMDKTKKLATIWFTLINMDAKKELSTERVEGKLGNGFGFRNYWASAIKNAIS